MDSDGREQEVLDTELGSWNSASYNWKSRNCNAFDIISPAENFWDLAEL
jgi:hypothetical protein